MIAKQRVCPILMCEVQSDKDLSHSIITIIFVKDKDVKPWETFFTYVKPFICS
jgi:hypothetical protein